MAAKIDPKVAKEKRAKKIAIGGGILLVLLLAYEGPKTMKALNPPAPKTAASESASASSSTTTTDASTSAATGRFARPRERGADDTARARAEAGQLSGLTTAFESKDPFERARQGRGREPARLRGSIDRAAAQASTPRLRPRR